MATSRLQLWAFCAAFVVAACLFVAIPGFASSAQSAPPTGVTISAGQSQVGLSWNPVAGATSYNVKRATTSGGPYSTLPSGVAGTLFTDTGLTAGTPYYYVITAVGNQETSPSSQVSATPGSGAAPDAPGGFAALPGNTQATLSWNASPGATSYSVRRATTSGGPYTEVGTPAGSGFTNGGLSNNTTYYFVVCARNALGTGPASIQVSVKPALPPSAPSSITAATGSGGVTLTWNSSGSVTGWFVKRSTTSGGPYTTIDSPVRRTYTDTAVSDGTPYYYVVSAFGSAGVESANSVQIAATPSASLRARPAGVSAVPGNNLATLSWNPVSGASSYRVKRADSPTSSFTLVGSPSGTSFVDNDVNNGSTYYYAVAASGPEGPLSVEAAVTPAAPLNPPVPPGGLTATAGPAMVALSWNAANATSYRVKRSTSSGGPFTLIAEVGSTSYLDSPLTNGTPYHYVVSGVNAAGEGGNSIVRSATPTATSPPLPTTGLNAVAGDARVLLSWAATPGASSYSVERTTSGPEYYTVIASGLGGTSYENTGLTNGVTYTYRVFALNGASQGVKSSPVSVMPIAPPAAPGNPSATPHFAEITLTWTAPQYAVSYNIKRGDRSGGPYTLVASGVVGTSYSDRGLMNETGPLFYVISAVDGSGEGPDSNQVSATPSAALPPGPPAGLSATEQAGLVRLTWLPAAGAQSYSVLRSSTSTGTPSVIVSNLSATSYVNNGLGGGIYFYSVVAVNAAGASPASNQVQAGPDSTNPDPLPPADLIAVPGNAQASLTWSASAGASSYKVKRSTVSGGPYSTVGNTNGTSYTVTGLSNNQTNHFVVLALNGSHESGHSNEASCTFYAPPAAPANLMAALGNARVELYWSGSSGAGGYNVKRSTASGGPYSTIASTSARSFVDTPTTGIALGTPYFYVVSAANAAGESAASNQVSATPLPIPAAPTNLVATSATSSVILNWNAVPFTEHYFVYRSYSAGGPFEQWGVWITGTSWTDTLIYNGTDYHYVVRARNSLGESPSSNIASGTALYPPGPTGLQAFPGNAQVTLTWNEYPGATGYKIRQSQAPGGEPTFSYIIGPTLTFWDDNVTNSITYYYTVVALTSQGQTLPSAEVPVTPTLPPPPPAPTGLQAIAKDASVDLSWIPSPGAAGYMIGRGINANGPYLDWSYTTTATFAIDSPLTNGMTFHYVVYAFNQYGYSPNSSVASATPSTPTNREALFIVGDHTLSSSEQSVSAWLSLLGYTVTSKEDAVAEVSDCAGKSVVVISAAVSLVDLAPGFATVSVPVVTWNSSLFGAFGLTTSTGVSSATSISITSPGHALASGMSNVIAVYSSAQLMSWGVPNSNAVVAATEAGISGRATVFGYEAGSTMPGGNATARRVGLFLSESGVSTLSADGRSLFNGAVRWAAGAPLSVIEVLVERTSDGSANLQWERVPGASSYIVLRSTSPTGEFSQLAAGLSGLSFVDSTAQLTQAYYYQVRAVNAGGVSAPFITPMVQSGWQLGVGVFGRPYVRIGNTFTTVWQSPEYEFSVGPFGSTAQVSPGSGALVVEPAFSDPGLVTITKLNDKKFALTISPSLGEANPSFTYTGTLVAGSAPPGASVNLKRDFSLKVRKRPELHIRFRFPEVWGDLSKQTQRDPDGTGPLLPSDVYSTNPTIMAQARAAYVEPFIRAISIWSNQGTLQEPTSPALEQANVGFYPSPTVQPPGDPNSTERFQVGWYNNGSLNGGNPNQFIVAYLTDRYEYPKWVHDLKAKAPGEIQVFFVREIAELGPNGSTKPGSNVFGFCPGLAKGADKLIFISDFASPTTLAHELGHLLGLEHPEFDALLRDRKLTGALINNPKPLAPPANVERYNLMWGTSFQRMSTRLTEDQCWDVYHNALNHPALLWPSPD